MPDTSQASEALRSDDSLRVTVENLGGIDRSSVSLDPGVTIFAGRNATNRTSFLRAVGDALGAAETTLKRDADEGSVELELGDRTVRREYVRTESGVDVSGDVYASDPLFVEYFACLFEDNPARLAVERGGEELREVLMRPVDTEEIRTRIRDRRRERNDVEARAEEIERQRERLPALRDRERKLESDLADVTAEIESLREEFPSNPEVGNDDGLTRLEDAREELATLRDRVQREEERLSSLYEERDDVQERLESHEFDPAELEEVDDRIDRLRGRKRRLADMIDELSSVINFNERFVSTEEDTPLRAVTNGDVTESLDPDSGTVDCWTCGTTVERATIDEQVSVLRELGDEHREERRSIQEELDELTDRRASLGKRKERRDELSSRLSALERELDRREGRLEDIRTRLDRQHDAVRHLEEELAASEGADREVIEGYRRVSELEYERGRMDRELADVREDIADLEAAAAERDDLLERLDELTAELDSLRSRIRDLEENAVEAFNRHSDELFDELDYRNISRVWLERRVPEDGQARFDLHVVRTDEDGTAYEDELKTLSESERKLIGLVVALVGYRVHEVHEQAPVILLDSLEPIDGERIAMLLDYFSDYAAYLLVALLPEDAAHLSEGYERVPADTFSEE